jgi:hypothetical protein
MSGSTPAWAIADCLDVREPPHTVAAKQQRCLVFGAHRVIAIIDTPRNSRLKNGLAKLNWGDGSMWRKWGSIVAAAALLASTSPGMAVDSQQGVLAPGKAAGYQKAEGVDGHWMWVGGFLVFVTVTTLCVTTWCNSGHNHPTNTTTSTTP